MSAHSYETKGPGYADRHKTPRSALVPTLPERPVDRLDRSSLMDRHAHTRAHMRYVL